MSNPLEQLKENYWLNIYLPYTDNPNAPICNLVIVSKTNRDEKYKYPIWKDKKQEGYGYVGNLDISESKPIDSHNKAKANAYQPDELDDEIPF
jgi:hypothetical protein